MYNTQKMVFNILGEPNCLERGTRWRADNIDDGNLRSGGLSDSVLNKVLLPFKGRPRDQVSALFVWEGSEHADAGPVQAWR